MVIDPSLFGRPVSVKEWETIATRPPARFEGAMYAKRFQYLLPGMNFRGYATEYEESDQTDMKEYLSKLKVTSDGRRKRQPK